MYHLKFTCPNFLVTFFSIFFLLLDIYLPFQHKINQHADILDTERILSEDKCIIRTVDKHILIRRGVIEVY